MSTSRRGRKLKLANPEEQPQISQFTVDIGQPPTNFPSPTTSPVAEAKGKKRRWSTGEKIASTKKRNLPSSPLPSSIMSIPAPDPNDATTAMLREIKKMEEWLSEKITTSKDQDLSEMEERLNNNIRSTIDTSIKDALKVIQTSLNTTVENNATVISHTIELKGLRDENSRLNRKVQQLTAEQSRMKQQLTKIENLSLENSLIIRGLAEDIKETEQILVEKLHGVLSGIMQGDTDETKLMNAKQITIKSIRRLGRPNRQRTRPVSAELYHKHDVDYILENRFDLEKGIYVDKEYPIEVERKWKALLPILRAAKRSSEFKKQSKLEDDKIILKGRRYDVNTLNQLPDELNVFKVTTRENVSTIGYFCEINPLSNFYPAPFTHEGVRYISSEQFIQASKAKYFNDVDTYNQIMGCSTSLECKRASRQIRNVDINMWELVASSICLPGIRAKFFQNPPAMDTLISKTGSKTIVECAADRLWGTGIPLNDPTCLDPQKWITQGIMGQILEDIRSEALKKQGDPQRQYPMAVTSAWPPSAKNINIQPSDYRTKQTDTVASLLIRTEHCPNTSATADQIGPPGQHPSESTYNGHSAHEEKTDHVSESTTPVSDTTEGTSTSSDVEMGDSNQSHTEHLEAAMEYPEATTTSPVSQNNNNSK